MLRIFVVVNIEDTDFTMARKADSFELSTNVILVQQGDTEFLAFTMTATALALLAHPIRFSEDPIRGVQRDLDERQVIAFMEAMEAGQPIPANLTLNLSGEWVLDGTELFGEQRSSTVEALDGQHRGEASRRLVAAGKTHVTDRYTFVVMAVHDASDELRRRLFMAQVHALKISSEHAAIMRANASDFRTKGEEEAYVIAQALMTREDSILKDRVHVGDMLRGPRGRRDMKEGCWLTLVSLVTALRTMTSSSSLIVQMPTDKKVQFVVDLLSAADEAYPSQFQAGGTLRTPFGIATLCLLAVRKDGSFRAMLQQRGYSKAELLRLFRMVPRFQWTIREGRQNRHSTPAMSVARFNSRLAKAVGDIE